MQQGSLDLPAEQVELVRGLARRVPVVLVVTLARPAILTPVADVVAAVLGDFGASDTAVMNVITGVVAAEGRLPFELPSSMDAVRASKPDVGADSADPLFPLGWTARR